MRKTGIVSALIIFLLMVVVYALALAAAISRGAEPAKAPCPALESPRHEALDRLAQHHANRMARTRHQSHNYFQWERYFAARRATGYSSVVEIVAETWADKHYETQEQVWTEFVRSWRTSRGHWSVARKRHKFIGVGMAQGRNGIHYGVILCCD